MDHPLVQKLLSIAASLDWSDWVTAIATLVLAVLTFVYVRLTRSILAAQSDPCVVLTVVKEMPAICCPLDTESYAHTVAAEKPTVKIAGELTKISRHLEHLVSGYSKLRIEVISLPKKKPEDESV